MKGIGGSRKQQDFRRKHGHLVQGRIAQTTEISEISDGPNTQRLHKTVVIETQVDKGAAG